jgi:hypothetical protein
MHEDPTLRVQVPAELLEQIAARAAELVLARLARALPMADWPRRLSTPRGSGQHIYDLAE